VSVAVDVSRDRVRIALSEERVREIVRTVCRKERASEALISVAFVTKAKMARMNREFLNHRGATDVITFELEAIPGDTKSRAIVGDIYISPDVARDNAIENGVSIRAELTRLVIHGTLHVLGYTHAEGADRMTGEMWLRQEKLLAAIV
jgi:rRNA maturation RNase YbeY